MKLIKKYLLLIPLIAIVLLGNSQGFQKSTIKALEDSVKIPTRYAVSGIKAYKEVKGLRKLTNYQKEFIAYQDKIIVSYKGSADKYKNASDSLSILVIPSLEKKNKSKDARIKTLEGDITKVTNQKNGAIVGGTVGTILLTVGAFLLGHYLH